MRSNILRARAARSHYLLISLWALGLLLSQTVTAQPTTTGHWLKAVVQDPELLAQSGRRPPMPTRDTGIPPLKLEEFLTQVEAYHPKLLGADAERRIASAKLLEKRGAFDPAVTLSSDYLRFNSTSSRGKLRTTTQNELELNLLTRFGVKLFAGSRLNLGSVKSPLSFTGDTGEYFFGLKLPLMRGARMNEKVAAERQAALGEPLANAEFAATRQEFLAKAASNYWEWVAAKRKIDIAQNLVQIAQIRADAVRERVRLGDLPAIDAVEADQEVMRRQGNLIKADRDFQKANFKLSLFLWDSSGVPSSPLTTEHVPRSWAAPIEYTYAQQQQARTLALERRPELQSLAINRSIVNVDLDLAKNQRLPDITLSFSPGRDTGNDSIGNSLKMGVSVTLPLRQRTADGRIAAAQFKIRKMEFQTQVEQQRILVEIDDAVSVINTVYQRYQAAERELRLAQQLEQGEREKFALGDSTLFLVNQRERATAEAENKLIDLQLEYQQGIVTLRAASVQY
jgi:outer membrane protein